MSAEADSCAAVTRVIISFAVGCVIQFTYTAKYPDEVPLMELTSTDSLEDDQVDMILEFLKEQVNCCMLLS